MLVLLALLLGATPNTYHLDVLREGATQRCPEGSIRARVVALLGRDPFEGAGQSSLRFTVSTRSGGTWSAVIRTTGPHSPDGVRKIRVPVATCAALDETVALAVALAIDPIGLKEPSAPTEPEAPSPKDHVDTVHMARGAPRPRPPEEVVSLARFGLESSRPSPRGPPPPDHAANRWRLGVHVSSGLAPDLALGPELGLLHETGPWRLGLGTRFQASSSRAGPLPTMVAVWTAVGDVCLGRAAMICLGLEAGVYRADAGRGDLRPHVAPGVTLKAQWAGAELAMSVSLPLWRQRFEVDGEESWRMPAWIAGVAVGVMSAGHGETAHGSDRVGEEAKATSPMKTQDGSGALVPMAPR